MRFLIYSILFLTVVSIACYLAIQAPFHFYEMAVKDGTQGEILKLTNKNLKYLKGKEVQLEKYIDKQYEVSIWKQFHFSNVEFPFPVDHPIISTLPILSIKKELTQFGVKFINRDKDSLFEFRLKKSFYFKKYNIYQKIFRLPFFKNRLRKISQEELWQDLFLRKIKRSYKRDYSQQTFFSMIYDLYILNLRKKTFVDGMVKFSFIKEKRMGIIQLKSDDEDWREEILFLQKNGIIYPVRIRSLIKQDTASAIRQRVFRVLNYKESSISSAKELYERYKQLPYEKRVDTSGVVYLFAGFTHVPAKESYLSHMISFLERGENNLFYLAPLYRYALRKFGSNFSKRQEILSENAAKALQTNIQKELERELKGASKEDLIRVEGEFSNSKEKKEYYLKKAKELFKLEEDDEDMLIEN